MIFVGVAIFLFVVLVLGAIVAAHYAHVPGRVAPPSSFRQPHHCRAVRKDERIGVHEVRAVEVAQKNRSLGWRFTCSCGRVGKGLHKTEQAALNVGMHHTYDDEPLH